MKRTELARLAGTSPENIRYYREKGIIHPKQLENQYFEYTNDDLIFLYQEIEYKALGYYHQNFHSQELNTPLFTTNSMQRIKEIDEQILQLQKLKEGIQKRLNHRKSIQALNKINHVTLKPGNFLYLEKSQFENDGTLAKKLLENTIVAKVIQITTTQFYNTGLIKPTITLELREQNLNYLSNLKFDRKLLSIYHHTSKNALISIMCLSSIEEINPDIFAVIKNHLKDINALVSETIRGIILQADYDNEPKFYIQFIFPISKID